MTAPSPQPMQSTHPDDTRAPSRPTARRAIAAASIGNALEFFDLALYALMASYIGRTFFPGGNPGVQLVQAYAVFGVTYLIRPLGGLLLGAYADRNGRKKALVLSIRLMVVGTLLLAVMPGYSNPRDRVDAGDRGRAIGPRVRRRG